jgi:hypothetical protein
MRICLKQASHPSRLKIRLLILPRFLLLWRQLHQNPFSLLLPKPADYSDGLNKSKQFGE